MMTTYATLPDRHAFSVVAEDIVEVPPWDPKDDPVVVDFQVRMVEDVTYGVAESWREVFEAASTPPRPLEEILDSEWRRW